MNLQFENLISWLYCPNNNITFQNIIDFVVKYKYPYDIVIMKYIQLLCFNGLDNNSIQEHLLKFNINSPVDTIEHIRKEEQHEYVIPEQLYSICKKNHQSDTQKKTTNQEIIKRKANDPIHENYPLVDPTRGRPKIDWCICYHEKCMKWCTTESHLLHHLKEHGCLTHHFHKKHETAVYNQYLTPEKIIQNNIIHCPSPICDTEKFKSPQELIRHLTLLGIPPFWKYGMNVKDLGEIEDIDYYVYKELEKKNYPHFTLTKPIFRSEICVCCCETKPQIVFLSCKHSNLCINCYYKLPIKKCPECRMDASECLPY
jgi:hypothetical protein